MVAQVTRRTLNAIELAFFSPERTFDVALRFNTHAESVYKTWRRAKAAGRLPNVSRHDLHDMFRIHNLIFPPSGNAPHMLRPDRQTGALAPETTSQGEGACCSGERAG